MNKKLFVGLIIAIILVVIGFIFGLITMVRFFKLNTIYTALDEYIKEENYQLVTTFKYKDSSITTEMYYVDGIGKNVAANGIYSWNDGQKAYMVDEENKKITALKTEEMVGIVLKDSFAYLVPGYSTSFFSKLAFAGDIENKIYTETIDGVKYKVIEVSDENSTKRMWISSKMNHLVKAEVEFPNGDIFYYDYSIVFGNTYKASVQLPDISEYTLVSGELEIEAKNFLTE